ncbi:OLC1v1036904C1 [Oldenlandia corymbosa var. corymbosa]|uniref:OLC1v1036904C1 n=1 Tax=Oldenlandia corymbosa var. corymbosa TaxID=529605 RepID=A0AAV1CX68_OLDCO|nr:OLC1v1036904C1 [Oldenlandia corymbosa var. corymbosa]
MNDQLAIVSTNRENHDHHHHNQSHLQESDQDEEIIRDIHALTPPRPPSYRADSHIHRSESLSVASEGASSENFTSMSREFNALVIAGSTIVHNGSEMDNNTVHSSSHNLGRIGEDDDIPDEEETNPLAIVPDYNPIGTGASPSSRYPATSTGAAAAAGSSSMMTTSSGGGGHHHSVQRVKKEEVESKISAWQTAKVAKVNNRFKREDAVISGWESEQVQKANSWMKKVERKLEEKRAKALEKMQNDMAKARRKAEERRASAEAKRGTKVAKILEIANLMRAVGRPPAKRSFF